MLLDSQLAPADLAYQESLIRERETEIREIETGIHELNEIFRGAGLSERLSGDEVCQLGALGRRTSLRSEVNARPPEGKGRDRTPQGVMLKLTAPHHKLALFQKLTLTLHRAVDPHVGEALNPAAGW